MVKGMSGGLGQEGVDHTDDICRVVTIGVAFFGRYLGDVQTELVLEYREIMEPTVEDMRAKHSQTCNSCVLSSRSFPCTSSRDNSSTLNNGLSGTRRRDRDPGKSQCFSTFQQCTGVHQAEAQNADVHVHDRPSSFVFSERHWSPSISGPSSQRSRCHRASPTVDRVILLSLLIRMPRCFKGCSQHRMSYERYL